MPDQPSALTLDIELYPEDVAVLRCHGRLVAGATSVLSAAVTKLIPTSKRIVLDLSDLKHMDSMGLGTLIKLYVSAKSAGCILQLMNLNQQIRNLLGLTNLLSVFTDLGEKGIKFL
jgi:anti-sigma B factor antagonist